MTEVKIAHDDDIINTNEGLNSNVPGYIVFFFGNPTTSASTGRDDFYTVNGRLPSQFSNSWGFHTNVGWVFNNSDKVDNDLITLNLNSSFELVPKGNSDKGRHNIQFGIWYEQRTNRSYSVAPRNIWDVARQQANVHIRGIAEIADTVGVVEFPEFFQGASSTGNLLSLQIDEGADNLFYRRVREVTGQPLTDYVNVDGLSPDQLSIDMFSAKELNDEGILSYYGYDHLGNEFDGTFDGTFQTVTVRI
jgi:hypothetical protein